jgi:hypothetical protein
LIKALNQAIDEFIDKGIDSANQHRRVIIIFTSLFDMPAGEESKLEKVIRKIHALSINLIIFGYEISKSISSDSQEESRFRDDRDQNESMFKDDQVT